MFRSKPTHWYRPCQQNPARYASVTLHTSNRPCNGTRGCSLSQPPATLHHWGFPTLCFKPRPRNCRTFRAICEPSLDTQRRHVAEPRRVKFGVLARLRSEAFDATRVGPVRSAGCRRRRMLLRPASSQHHVCQRIDAHEGDILWLRHSAEQVGWATQRRVHLKNYRRALVHCWT